MLGDDIDAPRGQQCPDATIPLGTADHLSAFVRNPLQYRREMICLQIDQHCPIGALNPSHHRLLDISEAPVMRSHTSE